MRGLADHRPAAAVGGPQPGVRDRPERREGVPQWFEPTYAHQHEHAVWTIPVGHLSD